MIPPYRIQITHPTYDERDGLSGYTSEIVDMAFTLKWARHKVKQWVCWACGDFGVNILDKAGEIIYDIPVYRPESLPINPDEIPF